MLVHIRRDGLEQGTFRSHYWTALHTALTGAGVPTAWVHTFFRHADVPSVGRAREVVSQFNSTAPSSERHLLLDRIDTAIVLSALRSYVRLVLAAVRLRGIRHGFSPAGSRFDFWPLFRPAWHASLFGRLAVRNCLVLAMYERLMSALPRQATGLYIKENQPWEMALLHAWRAAGHGRIIGVPHATVRFWDLRYFYDRRSYGPRSSHAVPTPDLVAVNGPAARAAYIAGGYPSNELVDVEALRFLHASEPPSSCAAMPPGAVGRVLICGDNTPFSNARMLRLVQEAGEMLRGAWRFIFKPHKAAPVDPTLLQSIGIEMRDGDLGEMLAQADIVLTGSLTSAAVDAYCVGKPVASLLDGRSLNGSPLRGLAGVRHFATAEDLAAILNLVAHGASSPSVSAQPYFWLDPGLPRWRKLLALPAV
jgi:surface carbohydrate biosynthesis protein (TIGR04326 family)